MTFITAYKYAKIHGLSKDTVYSWIRHGKFLEGDLKVENKKITLVHKNARPVYKWKGITPNTL